MNTEYKYSVIISRGTTDRDHLPIEDFKVGKYVGISLCYLKESVSDTPHPKTLYTPYAVFKIKDVKKGTFSFSYFGLRDEIILETPDRQTGSLFHSSQKDSQINITYREHIWTLDEALVSWIENDLNFTAVDSWMIIKLYDNTADVQKALQEKYQCKIEGRIQSDIIKSKPLRYTEPPKPQGPSESEMNDLFYNSK